MYDKKNKTLRTTQQWDNHKQIDQPIKKKKTYPKFRILLSPFKLEERGSRRRKGGAGEETVKLFYLCRTKEKDFRFCILVSLAVINPLGSYCVNFS